VDAPELGSQALELTPAEVIAKEELVYKEHLF
jgi:hypothetical protein